MTKRILESELPNENIKDYAEVLLVSPTDERSGVLVFTWPRMAQFVAADTPAPVSNRKQLLVVVDNPDDPETLVRVKAAVIPVR